MQDVSIVPNGVNLSVFKPLSKIDSIHKLGWDINKTHVLFAASPTRFEKNYPLAVNAINLLNDSNIQFHHLSGVEHGEIATILNASDVVLLTSLREGSPNIVKEAMACNRPVVATKVGDVAWLFGNEPGYFLRFCFILMWDFVS